MTDKTPAMPELPEGATLEDLLIPLRHAQQAPEWDGGKPANLQAAARDADEWLALIQRLNDAGRWLFSQPDSRPKLDGCRAALSKILCAPAQQAVPMTEDTDLLDFMAEHRVSVTPEYEGQWCARRYDDEPEAVDEVEAETPREALRELLACHHGITQRADGGEKQA